MKRSLLTLLAVFGLALTVPAQSGPFQANIDRALDRLSRAYALESASTLKIVVAVGAFKAQGGQAEALQTGAALRDAVLASLARSLVFTPVEREDLDQILTELELQMSGATAAEGVASAGALLNAGALLTGSITEQAETFAVTLKLVRVESGQIYAETLSVDKTVFVAAAEERLDRQYVSPMGIGLSVSGLGMTASGENASLAPFDEDGTTFFRRNGGVELRYRVNRLVMLGVGLDALYGQVYYNPSVAWDLSDVSVPNPTGTGPFTIYAQGIGIPVALYGVWSPLRRLSLQARLGAEYNMLEFSGRFDPSIGMGFGVNEFGPLLYAEFFTFSFQAGLEFFVSPRVALSVLAGYETGAADLPLDTQWHLTGIPAELDVDLSGFSILPRITVYF